MARRLAERLLPGFRTSAVVWAWSWLLSASLLAEEAAPFPGTRPLDGRADLADRMMEGLHRYVERKIDESVGECARRWKRDFSSAEAYQNSVGPNRERLRKILGIVDRRVPVRIERFGDDANPALVAKTDRYCIYQVRWPTLEDVGGEGLLLEPSSRALAHVVAIPDADQTPEQLVGLAGGIAAESQFARRLALAGFRVVVPMLVDRSDDWSGHRDIAWTNQPHREWIYRQAYMMGRHIIGYEVQKVLAVIDWFQQADRRLKVGVAGYGEGGLLAMDAAAVDPRIDACLVSGYFDSRQKSWREPLYRNVWGFLSEFGDAEVASLIAPRGLVVEYSRSPEVSGPPKARTGRRGGAAIGEIHTPAYGSVAGEFQRIEDAAARRTPEPAIGGRIRRHGSRAWFPAGHRGVLAIAWDREPLSAIRPAPCRHAEDVFSDRSPEATGERTGGPRTGARSRGGPYAGEVLHAPGGSRLRKAAAPVDDRPYRADLAGGALCGEGPAVQTVLLGGSARQTGRAAAPA